MSETERAAWNLAGPVGPTPNAPETAAPEIATRPEPAGPRPTAAGPRVRLKLPKRRSIREDDPDAGDQSFLERVLLGWTGSVVLHALLVLLLILAAFIVPTRKPATTFDTAIGEDGGSEADGLEPIGGLEQELIAEEALDPTAIEAEPLGANEPLFEVDPERILAAGAGEFSRDPGAGGIDFGVARFGEGTETIQGVDVLVGDPQFTLIWNTETDIDLHVIEPGGSHIYWADREGRRGGQLDVDDVDGYGPENIFWPVEDADPDPSRGVIKGDGPPGTYRWYVHYYGGQGGKAPPTNWKVRVKHDGQVDVYEGTLPRVGRRSRIRTLRVER